MGWEIKEILVAPEKFNPRSLPYATRRGRRVTKERATIFLESDRWIEASSITLDDNFVVQSASTSARKTGLLPSTKLSSRPERSVMEGSGFLHRLKGLK
jgi:hypothetical protein